MSQKLLGPSKRGCGSVRVVSVADRMVSMPVGSLNPAAKRVTRAEEVVFVPRRCGFVVVRFVDVDDLPLERAAKSVEEMVLREDEAALPLDAAVHSVDVATAPLDSLVGSLAISVAPRGSPSKSLDPAEKSVESAEKSVDVAVRAVSIAHRPVDHATLS